MPNFQPIVKWSGSKRSQCEEIVSYFPHRINIYYEPFCGGCSVLMQLLNSNISVRRYVCSDLNGDLIELWRTIQKNPRELYLSYDDLWTKLNKDSDVDRKRAFFEEQRDIYNKEHSPYVFFFIMRTTTNGMPRYNRNGEFNNGFHLTRNGIEPPRLYPILMDWSSKLKRNGVMFEHCSYEDILNLAEEGDLVYMDPPYFNTKGMYYGGIDFPRLFENLKSLNERNIKYVMSFDGKSGKVDNTCDVPEDCYKTHMYIKSGNSSFKRTIGKDRNAMVYESLYLNYEDDNIKLW